MWRISTLKKQVLSSKLDGKNNQILKKNKGLVKARQSSAGYKQNVGINNLQRGQEYINNQRKLSEKRSVQTNHPK